MEPIHIRDHMGIFATILCSTLCQELYNEQWRYPIVPSIPFLFEWRREISHFFPPYLSQLWMDRLLLPKHQLNCSHVHFLFFHVKVSRANSLHIAFKMSFHDTCCTNVTPKCALLKQQ